MEFAEGGVPKDTARRQVLVIGPPGERFWDGLAAIGDEADVAVGEDADTLDRWTATAEVIFVWSGKAPLADLWPRAKAVRWVHAGWAGVDGLLFPGLVESEVVLTRTPGVFGEALAEYAIAAMLYFAKRIPDLVAYQRERVWQKMAVGSLYGKTLGIVGLGDVGMEVAAKAKALGMRVVGLRRSAGKPPAGIDILLPATGLDELLAAADYVVLSAPLTAATRGMIGERELGLLKPGAVLVNIARGGIVREDALLAALHAGRLGGAAVDVFEVEPLAADSPLWDAPNLLISAHTVDNVPGWEERVVDLFVSNFRRYVSGLPLVNVVDKRRGY